MKVEFLINVIAQGATPKNEIEYKLHFALKAATQRKQDKATPRVRVSSEDKNQRNDFVEVKINENSG